ncbi:superoxide dismutase family protein [Nonomuraea sp. K274]|uniref:Superoxide dismutase family protein n=1 Tax=Nonomuraea cypriaca TaxID=1187855 RepID=A0A931F4A3_9ACTN|nr:superoxide dismutase family protein [Nonomuraea cypriaca]MBF8190673.1 superoxide dismutase family protein [Nonomuraea cypriaca]
MRVPAFLLVLITAASGCAGPPAPLQEAQGPAERSPGTALTLSGAGEFTSADTSAIAYDRKLVPQGAQASVTSESTGGTTRTSLVVEGLLPKRHYGVHLHTKPCGKDPEAAGPHFQHHAGQINPKSEVWLDLTTDAAGAGRSTSRNNWALDRDRLPGSLVIHSQPTKTGGPEVGMAGTRAACLTLKVAQ